jgi:hypothetical protein
MHVVIGSPNGEYLVECDTMLSGNLLQNNNAAGISAVAEVSFLLPGRTADGMVTGNW